jgi:exopolysaccharide biosynthesis polyprenyl glycosylphosphotransferase
MAVRLINEDTGAQPLAPLIADPTVRPADGRGIGWVPAARLTADLVAVGMAIVLAFILRFRFDVMRTHDGPFDLAGHVVASVLWAASVLWSTVALRLHDEDTLGHREFSRLRTATVRSVAAVGTAVFLLRLVAVSRGWFVILIGLTFVLLCAERSGARALLRSLRAHGRLLRPVVFVGRADRMPQTNEFRIVARMTAEQLPEYLDFATPAGSRPATDTPGILFDVDGRPDEEVWQMIVRAGGVGLPVYLSSPVRSMATDRLTMRELDGRTVVKVAPAALVGVRALQKRAFDLVVALVAAAILALPMALIAVVALVTSGPPILYGQERVGRGGRIFKMWKFRTMRVDAEAASGPTWATQRDPRRTPIGRLLRKVSLDELPQLWNVLVGDMSVVGPRPERPPFVEEFTESLDGYEHRHRIRPGMTGFAQVQGLRGDTPLEPRVEADNRYIEHWSVGLDVQITLRTFLEVLRARNTN